LQALGLPTGNVRFVPVDFEADEDWWTALLAAGLRTDQPAIVSSSGVSMYITKEATAATLQRLSQLAPGSSVVMTFMLPFELLDAADRPGLEGAARGAQASGTPWISFFAPDEIVALARAAGFGEARAIATDELANRYLAGRSDGLRASGGEGMLLAQR
jgi:O-methyltransferase involved in polyketide biosynthesis